MHRPRRVPPPRRAHRPAHGQLARRRPVLRLVRADLRLGRRQHRAQRQGRHPGRVLRVGPWYPDQRVLPRAHFVPEPWAVGLLLLDGWGWEWECVRNGTSVSDCSSLVRDANLVGARDGWIDLERSNQRYINFRGCLFTAVGMLSTFGNWCYLYDRMVARTKYTCQNHLFPLNQSVPQGPSRLASQACWSSLGSQPVRGRSDTAVG